MLLLRILTLKTMIKCAKHSEKTKKKVILHALNELSFEPEIAKVIIVKRIYLSARKNIKI